MDVYIYINKEKFFGVLDKLCNYNDLVYELSGNNLTVSDEKHRYVFSIENKDEDWIQPYDMDVDICLYTDITGKNDKTMLINGIGTVFALTNTILGSSDTDLMLMFEGEDCCIYRKNGSALADPVLKERYSTLLSSDSCFDFKHTPANVYEYVCRNISGQ